MSELDVIVIHVRAEQAAEYEQLFAQRELPRWREYKARGAFISARISRTAFGPDRRAGVVTYVIAVEVPSHAEHSEHDADPEFQEFNRLADRPPGRGGVRAMSGLPRRRGQAARSARPTSSAAGRPGAGGVIPDAVCLAGGRPGL